VCQCAVHKRCHDKILGKCPGSGKESQNTIVSYIYLYILVRSIEEKDSYVSHYARDPSLIDLRLLAHKMEAAESSFVDYAMNSSSAYFVYFLFFYSI